MQRTAADPWWWWLVCASCCTPAPRKEQQGRWARHRSPPPAAGHAVAAAPGAGILHLPAAAAGGAHGHPAAWPSWPAYCGVCRCSHTPVIACREHTVARKGGGVCEGWHGTYSFGLSQSTSWLLCHNNMTALAAWRGGALPGPHRRLLARRWLPAEQCCGLFSRDLVVQTSTGGAASEMA